MMAAAANEASSNERADNAVSASGIADSTTIVQMQNVDFFVDPQIPLRIRTLNGKMRSRNGGTIMFDDKRSFIISVDAAEVGLTGLDLSLLLNKYVFGFKGSPLTNLRVTTSGNEIIQKGTLHKGVDIPFQMWSVPRLQSDGRLLLHPDRLKIFGVNGTTLMHALGLHLDRMMDLSGAHGVSVKGDDLYLEPLAIIPPPTVDGKLTSVRVEGPLLIQEFARTPEDTIFGTYAKPDSGSRNFIYFRGGQLRFGKLTMDDTDLLIHDADEADPLDLYFAEYNKQLVAGHTSNLPNYGLRTWMVDYAKVPAEPKEKTVASRARAR